MHVCSSIVYILQQCHYLFIAFTFYEEALNILMQHLQIVTAQMHKLSNKVFFSFYKTLRLLKSTLSLNVSFVHVHYPSMTKENILQYLRVFEICVLGIQPFLSFVFSGYSIPVQWQSHYYFCSKHVLKYFRSM